MDFEQIVATAQQNKASDIHFVPSKPVFLRINSAMAPLGQEAMSKEQIQQILEPLITDSQKEVLNKNRQVDFLTITKAGIRLRANVFFQERGMAATFRIVPQAIPEFKALGFPPFVQEKLMKMKQGLILIVGPTGQGKSTTMASMLQARLTTKTENIITIEDPVEYVINSDKGVIQQREIGRDVVNFEDGIKASLRQDPDLLMVGEMRNLETISAALTMAETGHGVISTLHTNNGPETITRIIDIFPADAQDQIRSQLGSTLKMIISQRLVPTLDGKGLVLAYEVLTSNYAIQNYIRTNKVFQIQNVLQTDASGEMVQFEQSLAGLVMNKRITKEIAEEYAQDVEQLKNILIANGVK